MSYVKPSATRRGKTKTKMKQLKLEVGKIYRNRKGEEVRIVEKNNNNRYPYQGSNEEWYTEDGHWQNFGLGDPEDLIEEVPETRHTFAIPDGVKEITLDYFGNRIVVEMVPGKEPKPGDVMVNEQGSVYIFQSAWDDAKGHNHYVRLREDGHLSFGWVCTPGRPATPEEAQPLFDALRKAGKRWNPETMEVEEVTEIDRIREWVGMYAYEGFANREVYYTLEDLAEVISCYLEHKEGKK